MQQKSPREQTHQEQLVMQISSRMIVATRDSVWLLPRLEGVTLSFPPSLATRLTKPTDALIAIACIQFAGGLLRYN
jgi:hypothetical protein